MDNEAHEGDVKSRITGGAGAPNAAFSRIVAVAVGGSTRQRVNRAALAARLCKLHSLALRAYRYPWCDLKPVPCIASEAPGVAVGFEMVPARHMVLMGHMPSDDFRDWCSDARFETVTVSLPGCTHTLKPSDGAVALTHDSAPSYTRSQWAALFALYPPCLKVLRMKALGASFVARDPALVSEDGMDAFYRWANIDANSGHAFEAAVAGELIAECPSLTLPARDGNPRTWLTKTLLAYKAAGLERVPHASVGAAVDLVLDRFGQATREYDAFTLHHALRGIAELPGLLTHDFHFDVLIAVLKGDRHHDPYLRTLIPKGTVNLVHDIGVDPNCGDFLALRMADHIINLASSRPGTPVARSNLFSRSPPLNEL